MKKYYLLFAAVLCFMFEGIAQQRMVSGKVTDDASESLPGVTILIKGTTKGTVTDIDGNYKLEVSGNDQTLVFKYIGFEDKEMLVGTQSTIDVQLLESAETLQEVVVTALGTKQNARDVTYANQTVKAEDLLTTPSKNALEALRGKTAGVKIIGGNSVGASTKITLRGESSLTGNNNALIVVDGVPIDNTSTVGGQQEGEGGFSDFGNRFNDFDPNNIESITILKGPSATSLYGSRGASGVVVITTKSGQKNNFKINFNTTASVDQAYVLLERQNRFGQGLINPDGSHNFDSGENFSWGPEFDGVIRPWTSPVDVDGDGNFEYLSRPYSAVEDQLQNFFQTGYTLSNSLSLSGGSDKSTYYMSYSNTSQKGVLENTDYLRHNFTVNATSNLSDKLNASVNISYANVDQNTTSEGSRAFEGQNPYATAVQAPINIPYSELRDYKNPYHSFNGFYGSYTVNPYFIANEYVNNAKSENWLANVSLSYTPIEDVVLNTRIGTNNVSLNTINAVPSYAYKDHYVWEDNLTLTERGERQSSLGQYVEQLSTTRTIDWTTTASYNRALDSQKRLTLAAIGGLNFYDKSRRLLLGETQGGLVVPGIYNLGNSKDRAVVTQDHYDYRIIGLFANFKFGWEDKAFLEYSIRNDWSSSLPVDNQSFLYQSVGANAIISDFLGWDDSFPVNYFKFRTSYGTTGKDAAVHQLSSLYTINPTMIDYEDVWQITQPINGQTGASRNNLIGNANLKPEITKTFEIGSDINFLENRIELAYTYYNSNHTEQIVTAELPSSSGFLYIPVNIGEIQNSGHEISMTLIPLTLSNSLKWEMNLTWAKNKSLVKKISDQTDQLTIWDSGRGVTLTAEEGQPFGTWRGQVPRFTEEGQRIVDANGSPLYTTETEVAGNVQPDWIGGMVNTISFKGFSLTAVLDCKKGGDLFSLTKSAVEFNGTGLTTLIGDRKPFVIENSVVDNGDGTFSPNNNTILADAYTFDGNYTKHVLDASFLKLREVSIAYRLPRKISNSIKMKDVSVKLFANNLKFWLPEENSYADPEVNGPESTGTNVQGIEATQMPPQKRFGINLNLTF